MSYRVLLLEKIHPIARERLLEAGVKVSEIDKALSEDELLEKAKDFDAIGIRSKTKVTDKVLKGLPNLQAIGAFCIGINQVALECANQGGVPVFNAPYSNTRSVAELVICEMIALARQLGDRSMKAHQGEWLKSAVGAHEIRGKNLGIIGYGHIGSQVSVLAEAMGLNVHYYDIVKKLPLGNANAKESLKELLVCSDFVSLHVPETAMTKNMIGAEELSYMRQGAYLLNASRGSVVDIAALVESLQNGHLGGAAVDVFPVEPAKNTDSFESELRGLDNVILTPHIGGSTEEAQKNIGIEVSESLIQFLKNGGTHGAVNFPNLDLPPTQTAQRLVNVHKNVPGVLGEINGIVSKVGANIKRQFLSTDSSVGYVVMDLESDNVSQVFQEVSNLDTSMRTRLL